MSTVFNVKGYERFTPDENLKLVVLGMFADNCKAFMESDTYHNDLVALTGYAERFHTFRQLAQLLPTGPKSKRKRQQVQQLWWKLLMLSLLRAMIGSVGAMLRRSNTTSQRNQRGEYTNYWAKGEEGFYIDLSENGVVFTRM